MEEAEKGEILERATAEAASLFTDDLILEILSRLPVRSLHRFKCVSMPWRHLIADPANRKRLPQALAGFLYMTVSNNRIHHHYASLSGDGAAPFAPSLPYLHQNKDERIAQVDACNGLLLYRGFKKKMASSDDFRYVVCDPSTGMWVELPPRPPAPAPVNRYSRTAVSIYSSQTGAWSRRDSGMPEKVGLFCSSKCVFVGGMMYVIGNLEEFVLVGVDTEGKVWKTIRVPYGSRLGTIGSLQGCLHYAIASVDDNNKILDSEISL